MRWWQLGPALNGSANPLEQVCTGAQPATPPSLGDCLDRSKAKSWMFGRSNWARAHSPAARTHSAGMPLTTGVDDRRVQGLGARTAGISAV